MLEWTGKYSNIVWNGEEGTFLNMWLIGDYSYRGIRLARFTLTKDRVFDESYLTNWCFI